MPQRGPWGCWRCKVQEIIHCHCLGAAEAGRWLEGCCSKGLAQVHQNIQACCQSSSAVWCPASACILEQKPPISHTQLLSPWAWATGHNYISWAPERAYQCCLWVPQLHVLFDDDSAAVKVDTERAAENGSIWSQPLTAFPMCHTYLMPSIVRDVPAMLVAIMTRLTAAGCSSNIFCCCSAGRKTNAGRFTLSEILSASR